MRSPPRARARASRPRLSLASLAVVAACGGSSSVGAPPPIAHDGALPVTVHAVLVSNVLGVDAVIDGGPPGLLVVDTGAAFTGVDLTARPAGLVPGGAATLATIAVGGVTFRDVPFVPVAECGSSCGPFDVSGILGGDILRTLVVAFDYHGHAVVFGDAPLPPGAASTPIVVPFQLAGGGTGTIAGGNGAVVNVPATRVLVHATIEGAARTLLVDTGASYTLLRQSLFNPLVADGRKTMALVSATASGAAMGSVARARVIALADAQATGSPIASVADAFVDNLDAEVGARVDGMLGGSFLRDRYVVVDYGRGSLSLHPYDAPDPLSDEFSRVGVFLAPLGPGAEYVVGQLVPGSVAARAAPSLAGAVLLDVDGVRLAGLEPDAADHLLRGAPGTMHTLHVQQRPGGGGGADTFTLATEDLLALP